MLVRGGISSHFMRTSAVDTGWHVASKFAHVTSNHVTSRHGPSRPTSRTFINPSDTFFALSSIPLGVFGGADAEKEFRGRLIAFCALSSAAEEEARQRKGLGRSATEGLKGERPQALAQPQTLALDSGGACAEGGVGGVHSLSPSDPRQERLK